MARMRSVGIATVVAIAVLTSAGCGSDNAQGSDTLNPLPTSTTSPEADESSPPSAPPEDVRCPSEELPELYVPQDWTASSIIVCHDIGQSTVRVINVSAVLLRVGPGESSALASWGQAETGSFESMVYNEIVAGSDTTDAWLIPPGGWVVVNGSPASATVGLPLTELATAYALDKLIGYVRSRLTSPDIAAAQRVSACAKEVGVTIANTQDPSVDLNYLLADAMLGAGVQCGPLFRELATETPPPAALQDELARFRSSVRASATDDLIRAARNFVQVAR
jgi:hypothetical protein